MSAWAAHFINSYSYSYSYFYRVPPRPFRWGWYFARMASKSEDQQRTTILFSLYLFHSFFVSLSFILCLSYSLTYFTPLYPVLILTHHYITVTLLLLPLVLYRLSTSEERDTLHSKGRRLPIYVGWGLVWIS